MTVWILVETWGFDAPSVLGVFTKGADAYTAQHKLKVPTNSAVWGRSMSFNNIQPVEHVSNQVRVHRCNTEKGWFDKPVSFLEAMALLMTEVVEAQVAYTEDGLVGGWQAKKQQASELADVYIRLLDGFSRFGLDFTLDLDVYKHTYEIKHWGGDFNSAAMQLIVRIRDAIELYRTHGFRADGRAGSEIAKSLVHFYLQLEDTCDEYGVDLMLEFDRKMAVNEARPYRHGNKHA